MAEVETKTRKRLALFMLIVLLVFIGLGAALYQVQIVGVIRGEDLEKWGKKQWTSTLTQYPRRGTIYDRNGEILAASASAETVAVRIGDIKDEDKVDVIQKLVSTLDVDKKTLEKYFYDGKTMHRLIKRQITKEEANKLRILNVKGVEFIEEPKRYYPNGSLAAQIIGITKRYAENDGTQPGQFGIEEYYNKYLNGVKGSVSTEIDARNRELPWRESGSFTEPEEGRDIVLTIDRTIQYFVEREASIAMDKYNAKGVFSIVMDPSNGDILAMTALPSFDLNNPPRDDLESLLNLMNNPNTQYNFDPGSTFKIITAASGLEDGSVSLNTTIYCDGGLTIDGVRIKCWRTWGHGNQTFTEGVENSCNTLFMTIAIRLGVDKFYEYIDKFGFGNMTGLDVYGEEKGILIPQSQIKKVDIARIGFGQAISVTPIQMVAGISAVINGGNLMEPRLMKKILSVKTDPMTGKETIETLIDNKPKIIRRVISEDTSEKMRKILESVVENGTGRNAQVEGFRIGGKTGTSQKYENGRIAAGKNIASFIGFAPADDPRILIYFVVDEPIADVVFGSTIAAPHVQKILEDSLNYLGVPKKIGDKKLNNIIVPELYGMTAKDALNTLKAEGLIGDLIGEGNIVGNQVPMSAARVQKGAKVLVYTIDKVNQSENTQSESLIMPDLNGKSIRECNQILSEMGLKMEFEGSGLADSQKPMAGEKINKNDIITIIFKIPND